MQKRLEFALDFVRTQCDYALAIFEEQGLVVDHKPDGSVVTQVDLEINRRFINAVRVQFPTDGVIGEELSHHEEGPLQWVIDPIDGTVPFTMGLATWGISIALVEDGVPSVGLLANPVLGRILYAEAGEGAWVHWYRQGREYRLKVSDQADLSKGTTFGLPWATNTMVMKHYLRDVTFASLNALDLYGSVEHAALVCMGQGEAAMFVGDTPWDYAAADIIVREAGGRSTDIDGNVQRYDQAITGALISNGHVHDKMLALITANRLGD